ncbi:MAG TPA: histidine kinase, partial [Rhodoglobus sp.]|nr:histidine kinase [Rhodoglobus sp.]
VVLGQVPLLAWTLTVFAGFLLCFRGLRGLWPGLLLGGVNYAAMALMLPEGFIAPTALVALSMTLVATSVGSAARSQLRYFDSVEQRARDALATRDAEATRRVAEERLRIARDLHDVVGHEIAVLGMHLSVAEVTLTSDPAKTRESLGEARKGVQSVLRETQNILSLLRPDASDSRRPSPDGSGIDELVRNLAAAGMTIDADIPSLTTLAPSVGLTAYRIVQEALTNAQRYGDGTARVRVERTAHDLVLEVSNPESSAESSGPSGGHGLVGMRERATSAGGRLLIDRSGGRFTVRAELPLGGAG